MGPWDAGGTCDFLVIRLSGRPAIVADMSMKIKTESPRLTVTPGEWYASDMLAPTSTGFRHMNDIPKVIGAAQQNSAGFSSD